MIFRSDIGRPVAIMRAEQVRKGDRIVRSNPLRLHDSHSIDTVTKAERLGDDMEITHITPDGRLHNFATSIGNAVIVVR